MMKKPNVLRSLLVCIAMSMLLCFEGCDIHEYPDVPETVPHLIKLEYNEDEILEWSDIYSYHHEATRSASPFENVIVRYTMRTYPISKSRSSREFTQEFVRYGKLGDAGNEVFELDLKAGEYDLMVWADLEMPGREMEFFYNAGDFSGIKLIEHQGNTDLRDGFRGKTPISVIADIIEKEPGTTIVGMERPFAKFEIRTNDLNEFVEKQFAILKKEQENIGVKSPEINVDLNDYNVVIYYPAFMPDTYDMFVDKPVDSSTGISFSSKLIKVNDVEASLGFDYVFVNGKEAGVTVQVGIFDKNGKQLALGNPFNIPLKRGRYTIVRGSFLMQNTNGSIGINPGFDGEFNFEIK